MSVKDFQRHQLLFTRALARSSELSCGPIAPRRNIPRGLGACLVAVGGRNRETCFSATQSKCPPVSLGRQSSPSCNEIFRVGRPGDG